MDNRLVTPAEHLVNRANLMAKRNEGSEESELFKQLAIHLNASLLATRGACKARDALAVENAGLDKFAEDMLAIAWQGCSADGAEIQELALKYNIIRQESYCAERHETLVDDPSNFEDGDEVYFRTETPATDAAIAEIQDQGVEKFADYLLCPDLDQTIREFAAQLRKGASK